jgi:hypothetical protein
VRRATLLLGGIALVLGVYTGLARGGIDHRFVAADLHAVLMVFGFLGTAFAVDRAAEVDRRWAGLAPVSSAASVLALPVVRPVGGALLVLAGGLLAATYLSGDAGQDRTTADILGLLGALAWVAAAALWLLGAGPIRITPLLAVFLVLTLVRTQAARDQRGDGQVVLGGTVLGGAVLFSVGAVTALGWRSSGLVLAGSGLVALATALAPLARRRLAGARGGAQRFESICAALATGWLAASGLLWIAVGAGASGALVHDAVVHSLFLGAVFTHVMGLTPALLPALVRVPAAFTRSAWLPVAVLQVSVLARIGADLAGSASWREIALHGNVGSLLLFLFLAGAGLRRARRLARRKTTAPEVS